MACHRIFRRSLFFSVRWAKLIVMVSLALLLISIFCAGGLRKAGDLRDQLDPDLQTTRDTLHLDTEFEPPPGLIGIVENPENASGRWSNSSLCQLQKMLIEIRDLSPRVLSVFSPFSLRQSQTSPGHFFYPTMLSDPCLQKEGVQNLLAIESTPWQGLLTDKRGEVFLFMITISKLSPPGPYGSFDPGLTEAIMAKSTGIRWLGNDVSQLYALAGMGQANWLNLLALLIIVVFFRVIFGTWRASLVFLGVFLFIAATVFGGMALAGQPLDVMATSLFLILLVSSLEDFIFIAQQQLENPRRKIWRLFLTYIEPSFFTSLTSVCGFGSLLISDIQPIRRFGMWAAGGALMEWLGVFFCLPAFIAIFPRLGVWTNAEKAWRPRLPVLPGRIHSSAVWLTARLSLLAIPLGVALIPKFSLSQTPSEIFPIDHPFSQAISFLKKDFAWIAEASLVFAANSSPQLRSEILQKLRSYPLIEGFETEEMTLDFLNGNGSSLQRQMIQRDLGLAAWSHRYRGQMGETRALLRLKQTNTEAINHLREAIEQQCPKRQCFLAGDVVAFADSSKKIIKTLYTSLFLSLGLVASLIGFLCWRKGHTLVEFSHLILSSVWGSFALLVLIYLFGLQLNIVTCIVTTVLVGLTGDNAIQFLYARKECLADGIEKRAAASIRCSLAMALIPLVFLGSYFEPPRVLGALMSMGFLLAIAGDLWILQALLNKRPQSSSAT